MFRPESRRPQFTSRIDPPVYGHICPHCQKRYGNKQEYITIIRCNTCPVFKDSMTIYPVNYSYKKRKSRAKGL
jgi:hypothetical protein